MNETLDSSSSKFSPRNSDTASSPGLIFPPNIKHICLPTSSSEKEEYIENATAFVLTDDTLNEEFNETLVFDDESYKKNLQQKEKKYLFNNFSPRTFDLKGQPNLFTNIKYEGKENTLDTILVFKETFKEAMHELYTAIKEFDMTKNKSTAQEFVCPALNSLVQLLEKHLIEGKDTGDSSRHKQTNKATQFEGDRGDLLKDKLVNYTLELIEATRKLDSSSAKGKSDGISIDLGAMRNSLISLITDHPHVYNGNEALSKGKNEGEVVDNGFVPSALALENLMEQKDFLEEIVVTLLAHQKKRGDQSLNEVALKSDDNRFVKELRVQLENSIPLPICQHLLQKYGEMCNTTTPVTSPNMAPTREMEDMKVQFLFQTKSKERWQKALELIQDRLSESKPSVTGQNGDGAGLEIELEVERMKNARLQAELGDRDDRVQMLEIQLRQQPGPNPNSAAHTLAPLLQRLWSASILKGDGADWNGGAVPQNLDTSKYWHTKFRLARHEIRILRQRWDLKGQLGDREMLRYLQLENSHLRTQVMENKLIKKSMTNLPQSQYNVDDKDLSNGDKHAINEIRYYRLEKQINFLINFKDVLCQELKGLSNDPRLQAANKCIDGAAINMIQTSSTDKTERLSTLNEIILYDEGKFEKLRQLLRGSSDSEAPLSPSHELLMEMDCLKSRCKKLEAEKERIMKRELSVEAVDESENLEGVSVMKESMRSVNEPELDKVTGQSCTQVVLADQQESFERALNERDRVIDELKGNLIMLYDQVTHQKTQLSKQYREKETSYVSQLSEMRQELGKLKNELLRDETMQQSNRLLQQKLQAKSTEFEEAKRDWNKLRHEQNALVCRLEASLKEREDALNEAQLLTSSQIMKENTRLAARCQYLDKSLSAAKSTATHCQVREARMRNEVLALKTKLSAREVTIKKLSGIITRQRQGLPRTHPAPHSTPTTINTPKAIKNGLKFRGDFCSPLALEYDVGEKVYEHDRLNESYAGPRDHQGHRLRRMGHLPLSHANKSTIRRNPKSRGSSGSVLSAKSRYKPSRRVTLDKPRSLNGYQHLSKPMVPSTQKTNGPPPVDTFVNPCNHRDDDRIRGLPNDINVLKNIISQLRDRLNELATKFLEGNFEGRSGEKSVLLLLDAHTQTALEQLASPPRHSCNEEATTDIILNSSGDATKEQIKERGEASQEHSGDEAILADNYRLGLVCQSLRNEVASLRQELQNLKLGQPFLSSHPDPKMRRKSSSFSQAYCIDCSSCALGPPPLIQKDFGGKGERAIESRLTPPSSDYNSLKACKGHHHTLPKTNKARYVYETFENTIMALEKELKVKTLLLATAKRALTEAAHREKCLQRECFALNAKSMLATSDPGFDYVQNGVSQQNVRLEIKYVKERNERLQAFLAAILSDKGAQKMTWNVNDTLYDSHLNGLNMERMIDKIANYDNVISENIDLKLELLSAKINPQRRTQRFKLRYSYTDIMGGNQFDSSNKSTEARQESQNLLKLCFQH